MQHRAVFRHVDALAGEHRVNAPTQARLRRQGQQQAQGFIRDAVL
jgi:hypothetical protein